MIRPASCHTGSYYPHTHRPPERYVFLTIAIVLIILWALGFFVFPVGGGLIHLLLVIAIIAIIWHFVAGRRRTIL